MRPVVGAFFTHKTIKANPQDKHSPGAQMVVTGVKMHWVHFRYANPTSKQAGRPGFGLDYAEFVRNYPEACEEES